MFWAGQPNSARKSDEGLPRGIWCVLELSFERLSESSSMTGLERTPGRRNTCARAQANGNGCSVRCIPGVEWCGRHGPRPKLGLENEGSYIP